MTTLMLSAIGVILLVLWILWLAVTRGSWISPPPEPDTNDDYSTAGGGLVAAALDTIRSPESRQVRRARERREKWARARKDSPTTDRRQLRRDTFTKKPKRRQVWIIRDGIVYTEDEPDKPIPVGDMKMVVETLR